MESRLSRTLTKRVLIKYWYWREEVSELFILFFYNIFRPNFLLFPVSYTLFLSLPLNLCFSLSLCESHYLSLSLVVFLVSPIQCFQLGNIPSILRHYYLLSFSLQHKIIYFLLSSISLSLSCSMMRYYLRFSLSLSYLNEDYIVPPTSTR